MSAKLKAGIYGIISLVGNGAILAVLPDPYRLYAFLAFNVLQVLYAFFDPSYTVHLLGKVSPTPVQPPQA